MGQWCFHSRVDLKQRIQKSTGSVFTEDEVDKHHQSKYMSIMFIQRIGDI